MQRPCEEPYRFLVAVVVAVRLHDGSHSASPIRFAASACIGEATCVYRSVNVIREYPRIPAG
jgi:hypothetical protein